MSKKTPKKASKKTQRRAKKRVARKPPRAGNPSPVTSNLLSVKQAADIAGTSTTTIYRWLEVGTIEGDYIGERRVVRRQSLEAHLRGAA